MDVHIETVTAFDAIYVTHNATYGIRAIIGAAVCDKMCGD